MTSTAKVTTQNSYVIVLLGCLTYLIHRDPHWVELVYDPFASDFKMWYWMPIAVGVAVFIFVAAIAGLIFWNYVRQKDYTAIKDTK